MADKVSITICGDGGCGAYSPGSLSLSCSLLCAGGCGGGEPGGRERARMRVSADRAGNASASSLLDGRTGSELGKLQG